jgi:hypothetical protein
MGFVSAISLQQPVTRNRIRKGVAISMAWQTGKAYLNVRIDNETLKEARLILGDRLDVLFDKDARLGLIKRVKEGGWQLSKHGDKAARVRIMWAPGIPRTVEQVECTDVISSEADGVMFAIPWAATFIGAPKAPEAEKSAE